MTTVKIECGCGQNFAFDVEPVNGRVGADVACPACGADRTDDANAVLSLQVPRQHTPVAAAAPITVAERLAGIVERPQAEAEARAKISWGDPPEDVIKYLMLQRFSHAEASELVTEMFNERAATVRATGIRKIIIGSGAIGIAVIAILLFLMLPIRIFVVKILAFPAMLAMWGCWKVITGIVAVIAPKMEDGDVAEQ